MESSFVREPVEDALSISVNDFDQLPREVQEALRDLAAGMSDSAARTLEEAKKGHPLGERQKRCYDQKCQPLTQTEGCAWYVTCKIVDT